MPGTPDNPSLGELAESFWLRYSRQVIVAAVVIVVALAGWFGWNYTRERAAEADNKRLGSIYVMLHGQDYTGAERALTAFLAGNPSSLARDKANLFLGKILYMQQRYDEAGAAYSKVSDRGKSGALLHAGALHGLAASRMQLGQYAEAAGSLEELVKEYGVVTGDPEEQVEGEEVADFAPNVPNALWKLALCRRELGETDAAKAAAERIVKAYPGSLEARDAEKLLATL